MAGSVARLGVVLALGMMVGAASPTRADVVINFDNLSSSTAVTTQYQSQGVIFSDATVLTQGQNLSSLFPPHSGANVVYNATTGTIQATAVTGSMFSSVGGYITGNTSIFLDAYNVGGTLIGSVHTPGANYIGSGGTPNTFLTFSGQGIAFVRFHDGGNSFSLDDFTFNSNFVPSPEPATLVSAGFGVLTLIGYNLRRRLARRAA